MSGIRNWQVKNAFWRPMAFAAEALW